MINSIPSITAVLAILLANTAAFASCNKIESANSDFPDSLTTTQSNTGIQTAWYDNATTRYTHGVLGDAIEPSKLVVTDQHGCARSLELDQSHVFEDLAPRLAEIDTAAGAEVVTIRSHRDYGAQIAIYQLTNNEVTLLTTTPYIGTSNRWLAPVGIADFNNDGDMDIAFVDRPHLAKMLRVWSYTDGKLNQIASKAGYSNHRIGEAFISGGIKTCQGITTMITADTNWERILETTLEGGKLASVSIGEFIDTSSLQDALDCK